MVTNKFKSTVIVGIIMSLLLVGSVSAALIAQYEFEGNANNSVGRENGTLKGGAHTVIDPERGWVLALDGIDDFVLGSDSLFDFVDTTFTACGWFRKSDAAEGIIVSEGGKASGWVLDVSPVGEIEVLLKAGNGFDGYRATSITNSYADGQWHHVAAVITTNTSSASGNNADIYVDGTLVSATHVRTNPYGPSPLEWSIGARDIGYRTTFFNGMIDDVRVYDFALTADQLNKYVIPEPASIVLIAMGGLLLRGKKQL
jgi:hypothetical protein